MKCPDCDANLRKAATECRCGWSMEGKVHKPPHKVRCAGCSADLVYPRRSESPPGGNCIVGRSMSGGYLCGRCYQSGERFDYRSKAEADFLEAHRHDEWRMLISACYQLKGAPRADFSDAMGILKELARRNGGFPNELPYDPGKREAA